MLLYRQLIGDINSLPTKKFRINRKKVVDDNIRLMLPYDCNKERKLLKCFTQFTRELKQL